MTQKQTTFEYHEYKQYKFYKETLADAEKFLFEIDQKLSDRQPIDVEHLTNVRNQYQQEIVGLKGTLKYYVGIEQQFNTEQ